MELFSFLHTSEVKNMTFPLQIHLEEYNRRFWDISVLDASVYEQCNVHIKKAYESSSKRRAIHMQKTLMLMELQQKG